MIPYPIAASLQKPLALHNDLIPNSSEAKPILTANSSPNKIASDKTS